MRGSGNDVNKQRLQQHQKEQGSKKAYEEPNDLQCSGVRNQFPRLQSGDRGACAARAVHLSAALKISLESLLSSICRNEGGSQETDQIQQTKAQKVHLSWISSAFLIIPHTLNLIPTPESPGYKHC